MEPHLSAFIHYPFTFSHNAVGHQTSGARASTSCLSHHRSRSRLDTYAVFYEKPCLDCIYNVFIYKQIYGEKGRRRGKGEEEEEEGRRGGGGGGNNENKKVKVSNGYNLIMQVLTDGTEAQINSSGKILHKKSP